METFILSYMKSKPVVKEEMSFKEKVYGRKDDGQTMNDGQRTIAHSEPAAQVS